MTLQRGWLTGFGVAGLSWSALAAVLGAPALAEPPTTLQQALAAAYSSNPSLLAARAQLRATDEGVPQALAGWRPTVTLTGSEGYQGGTLKFQGNSLNNAGTLQVGTASITQPIFNSGKTRAQTAKAESAVRGQRARLVAQEQTVLLNTVNAYVGVIQAQQILQLDISNVQVLTLQLQATYDRYRVGELTRTDVAQAEAALAQGQADLQTAAGSLATARATFLQQVGEVPGKLIEPQPLAPPVKTREQATSFAAANNPTVLAAVFDDSAAKDAINVAFSALGPTFSVQAQYQQTTGPQLGSSVYTQGPQILGTLSMPLYQGGAEYSTIRQARQTEQQARKAIDDARRTAVQQASQAWDTLIAARAAAESTRSRIRADEIALQGVEQEAIVGSRTTQDVLNAQQELLNAQTALVQNLASLVSGSYGLAGAVGRLTARDLALQVPLYDEKAYYHDVRDAWIGTGDAATNQPGR